MRAHGLYRFRDGRIAERWQLPENRSEFDQIWSLRAGRASSRTAPDVDWPRPNEVVSERLLAHGSHSWGSTSRLREVRSPSSVKSMGQSTPPSTSHPSARSNQSTSQ